MSRSARKNARAASLQASVVTVRDRGTLTLTDHLSGRGVAPKLRCPPGLARGATSSAAPARRSRDGSRVEGRVRVKGRVAHVTVLGWRVGSVMGEN